MPAAGTSRDGIIPPAIRSSSSHRVGPRWLLLYLLLAALFYLPLLLGLRSFPKGDFTDHFLPFSLFQRAELLAGRLPLWNPYTYSGHPFLADVQAAVYYPLSNLVLGLTLPWAGAGARLYWLQVEAIVHVALAGFFTYLLARRLTGRPAAAILAGCTFAFSGYLTGYPPLQLAVLRTAIWLPLILWLLLRAFSTPRRWRFWVCAAVAYAVAFLGGHPQTFLYISYAVAGWILLLSYLAWRNPAVGAGSPRPGSPRPYSSMAALAGRIAVFYALFLGLSAAQLLPSAEFTRFSVRASADYAFLSGGFPLQDTWQMLLPGVLTSFSPLYAGLIPLGLALMATCSALPAVRRAPPVGAEAPRAESLLPSSSPLGPPGHGESFNLHPSSFILYFAGLGLLALLVSYGDHGFLYRAFYELLPGWRLFRGQERAAYLVAFALSLLAGFGAAWLEKLAPLQRRRAVLIYAGVVASAIAVFAVFWVLPGRAAVPSGPLWTRLAATAALLLVAFCWLAWRDRPPGWLSVGLIVLTLADLFIANFATNLDAGRPAEKAALSPEVQAVAAAVQEAGAANLGLPGRVYNEYRVFDDYGMRSAVEDAWGSSPLRLARYAALYDQFPLHRLWRLAGIDHVLTWRRELPPEAPNQILEEFPQATDTTYLHRLAGPNPRAWITHFARPADDTEALQLLGNGGFDIESTAIVPLSNQPGGADASKVSGLLAPPGQNSLSLERLAPDRLRIHANSDNGGLLVVSENWMPGWTAIAQSAPVGAGSPRPGAPRPRPLPVYRADLSFLGIPIGPGQTTIDLAYRPTSARLGLAISLFALAFLVIWLLSWKGRRPRRTAASLLARVFTTMEGRYRIEQAVPAVVALFALALRVFGLGHQELRGDEAFGYFFSHDPLGQFIRATITLREPHPLGSYLVQKGWGAVAGDTEFAWRFASAWFGVLAVTLLYRLARELGFGRLAAALSGGLLAVSPYAIWHSQDARMYSMSLALTIASTLLALRALRTRKLGVWIAYICVSWLALHVHYYAAFVLLAQNAYVLGLAVLGLRSETRVRQEDGLLPRSRGAALRDWILSQLILALLYLPWLILARDTLLSYHGNGDSPGLLAMWIRSLGVFAVGETMPPAQRAIFGILGGALATLGAVRMWLALPPSPGTGDTDGGRPAAGLEDPARSGTSHAVAQHPAPAWVRGNKAEHSDRANATSAVKTRPAGPAGRQGRAALGLLLAYLSVPLLATWVGALSRPIFNERYLVAALPPFLLLLASGVLGYPGRDHVRASRPPRVSSRGAPAEPRFLRESGVLLLALLLIGVFIGLGNHYLNPEYSKTRGWSELAAILGRFSAGLPPQRVTLAQTYPDPTLWYYYRGPVTGVVVPPEAHSRDKAASEVTELAAMGVERVVIAIQPEEAWDDEGIAESALGQEFRRVASTQVAGWPVQVYSRAPAQLARGGARFASGLELAGFAVQNERLVPGDLLLVHLQWSAPEGALRGGEKVTVQLLNGEGKLVAQTNDAPLAAADPEAVTLWVVPLPLNLAPGQYRLITAVYDPAQPGAPRLRTVDGADAVELAVLTAGS